MYHSGEQVMYGIHGVCKIIGLETRKIDRKTVEYYVLEPVAQTGSRFYIPTHNEAAVAKLHPIITSSELNSLLQTEQAHTDSWIEDENQRKLLYRDLITSSDRAALIRMVASIHQQKQKQEEQGKKLHMCDANFLRDAEKLLNTEFSLVLNIPQEDVGAYIQNIITSK